MTQRSLILCALFLSMAIAACSDRPTDPVWITTPAGPDSAEPHVAVGPDGRVILSWLEAQENGTALRISERMDDGWGTALTVGSGEDWFVNWADFPSVVPLTDGLWAAHWFVRNPNASFAYDVVIATSDDEGATWSSSILARRDGTVTDMPLCHQILVPGTEHIPVRRSRGRA